jgi:arginyl-tRNA synthetase
MNDIQLELRSLLSSALKNLQLEVPKNIHLEHPGNRTHGDFSTNLAMTIFAQSSKQVREESAGRSYQSPRQLAEEICGQLNKNQPTWLEKIEIAGPGFINFRLSNDFFLQSLIEILQRPDRIIQHTGAGKKIVVEYSSPNIAKPFTIGHLRSTVIGAAVANIKTATGWTVFRDNHLGDWGTQFGKQIYAMKKWGDEEAIDKAEEPVKELVALYVKFHAAAQEDPSLENEARAWFKKLEDGDEEARRLWKKCVEWSLKEFQRIYKRLSVTFTENDGTGYGESFFEDKMSSIVKILEENKLLTQSEGAKLIFFPEDKYPPLMILKKDGATLYATRDLATDYFRLQHYGQDVVVVNEVGIEQSLYWQQIHFVEEMLGWYRPGQRIHVGHGMYRFKDQKMSTRKGNVIWLEDVLNEAVRRARSLGAEKQRGKEKNTDEDHSEAIGIGALKWNDLKRSANLDVVFDWDEILNLEGNSGPYLQYTYARCRSVLRKVAKKGFISFTAYGPQKEEKDVLQWLYQFNEVAQKAAEEFAPHYLATYLFELAQSYNSFYNKLTILGSEGEMLEFRLALTAAVAEVLQQGLQLLGIQTVENM